MGAFIREREAMLAPTYRGNRDLNFEHWDMDRIRRYIDMLCAFGFNSIQLGEIRAYVSPRQKGARLPTIEALARTINEIADYAGTKGMRRSFFVWAQVLFELHRIYCPSNPPDRASMETEYDRMAETYAPHFDRVVAYWGEPGPCRERCGRCDYSTYQEMTGILLDRFREHNPHASASFNIWGLLRPERAGKLADKTSQIADQKSPRLLERLIAHRHIIEQLTSGGPIVDDRERLQAIRRLASSDALPGDIGICIDGCTTGALTWSGPEPLHFDEAEAIAQTGRPVGVWGWYLTDYEGAERSDFEIRRVAHYFESFPEHIGAIIDWHSVDITSHGWPPIILNAYVAGQKMQDPRKPLDEILREFCSSCFGEELGPAMEEAYLVLDKAPLVARPLPKVRIMNLLGTTEYEDQARTCLRKLESVPTDSSSGPRFPVIIEQGRMRAFTTERLRYTISVSRRLREFQQA